MSEMGKTITAGIVLVAVITAFGIHSQGLSQVGKTGFQGTQGLLNTAEKG